LLVALLLGPAASQSAWARQEAAVVGDQEILDELKAAPGTNPERVERIKELFLQAGAPEEAIELQPVKGRRPDDPLLHNVIATKKGKTDKVIVVGGHLDKVAKGDGVIDDWSGSSMATNLYQALKDVDTEHTFVFIGFAYEEQGLVGSREYVKAQGEGVDAKIRAMVNIECVGVGGPFIWTNGSNDELEKIAHKVAGDKTLKLEDHVIQGVGADSIPFEQAGIPTITFDGLPLDRISLIHSDQDRFDNISPETYVTTYRLVTHYLMELDRGGVPDAARQPKVEEPARPRPETPSP
jgi:aminopeptidase-like protein